MAEKYDEHLHRSVAKTLADLQTESKKLSYWDIHHVKF